MKTGTTNMISPLISYVFVWSHNTQLGEKETRGREPQWDVLVQLRMQYL